eukprot:TRINITY_DN68207_c0_g1_i1.p1 TRINITY_DN68207_c0_g1~~TRINITY_DN68207_c0_g1_i1.p1  ORF type:complete len:529 (+),score=61.44 TRINITY_DN68207_c0_g1_i1:50-1588(+)
MVPAVRLTASAAVFHSRYIGAILKDTGRPLRGRRAFAAVVRASSLQPVVDAISIGLRGRLNLGETGKQPCVAVAGRSNPEFAAAVRAVRAAGAVVAPIDVQNRDSETLAACLAESHARMAITAGACAPEEHVALRDALKQVGILATSTSSLLEQGRGIATKKSSATATPPESVDESPPMVMFTDPSAGELAGPPRAAEVPGHALEARVRGAVAMWGLTERDTVITLGLTGDAPTALVDALEAPLSVGAAVCFPCPKPGSSKEQAWDLWAALRDEHEATVAFIDPAWCWRMLDAHEELAAPIQAQLAKRWADKPLRRTIVVSRPTADPSQELSMRWAEVFGCPLTWLFSCAEAGSLYTAHAKGANCKAATPETAGLEWRLADEGELLVRGSGVFSRYIGRPASSKKIFELSASDNKHSFCHTGHKVIRSATGDSALLLPEIASYDRKLESMSDHMIEKGPPHEPERRKMRADWRIKRVWIQEFYQWRANNGVMVTTKKHNNVAMKYTRKKILR